MVDFTITIGPNTKTRAVSVTDTNRVIAMYKARYGPWIDENGDTFNPTNAQIFDRFSQGVFRGIKNAVLQYEREVGEAAVTVPDVTIPD